MNSLKNHLDHHAFSHHAFIILAAGNSTRFPGNKLQTCLAGIPLIEHTIRLASSFVDPEHIYVVSQAQINLTHHKLTHQTILQSTPNGTGGALIAALQQQSRAYQNITVLLADTPLITISTIKNLLQNQQTTAAIMHTNGTYGRLTLQDDIITSTLEHRSDSFDPNIPGWSWAGAINFHIPSNQLLQLLQTLQSKSNEIQLTDLFTKLPVHTIQISPQEGIGINTYDDFILASQYFTLNLLKQHKIIVSNPNSLYITANSILETGCTLSNNLHIHNSHIKSTANILPFTYIENSTIEGTVGPFACIKNNSHIHQNAVVGSFVDIKNSTLSTNVKVKHLSYIGNCSIGHNTNIGAGTITCNYNKTQNLKSTTTIGQNCDIGSNCSLIAPVIIEDNAQIGAGSVITKTVPSNKLAVSRSPQKLYRKLPST